MAHFIIGTAGHIDHGKTALVKALTGVDTDRLREEKERGLTIDLGFAHLGDQATIIDVPGHEKFIRNMVAGVSTIDLVLFVVAADDGVMPQTREHLDILKILQIKHGIIVLTKVDLVDEEWLGLVKEDVARLVAGSFLEAAPVVAVSSVTGDGIDELRAMLQARLQELTQKEDRGVFWMPVDRVFTMKGFGTVVTGSVLSGRTHVGATLELLPQHKRVRVRGLQKHNRAAEEVQVGDRAALNLQTVEKQEIHRGDVVTEPGYFRPSHRFDARLQLLPSAPRPVKPNTRVRLHFGTSEVMARVSLFGRSSLAPGETGYVQFHLEKPGAARRLDPFVVRQYSPTITIGGGVILNADAPRRKFSDPGALEELRALESEHPGEVLEQRLLAAGYEVRTLSELTMDLATSKAELHGLLDGLQRADRVHVLKKQGETAVVHATNLNRLLHLIEERLETFHQTQPTKLGLEKQLLSRHLKQPVDPALLNYALARLRDQGKVAEEGGLIRLAAHRVALSAKQKELREKVAARLYEAGFATPSLSELAGALRVEHQTLQEVVAYMISAGEIVRVEGDLLFHARRVQEARKKLVDFLNKNGEISVSQFKDLLGDTSRKYALPLLIYFDALRVTERVGDVRVLGET